MTKPTEINAEALTEVLLQRGAEGRSVTAIVGAPGSGKSTLSDELAKRLNFLKPGSAAVLPMDGYHYDDLILAPKGWQSRKGAPHTFDVAGFSHILLRLRANAEPEIAVPVFDRELEISRSGGRLIDASVRHLIVEGNYLLLEHEPWRALESLFDTTVFLDVPKSVLTRRLEDRWKYLPQETRVRKLQENDLPNADLVQSRSRPAEFVIRYASDAAASRF